MREKIYSALFFMMGFMWFMPFLGLPSRVLELSLILLYMLSHTYRKSGFRLSSRFRIVFIFSVIWLIHLSLTAFIELARHGYIPARTMVTDFSERRVLVEHLIYGPFINVVKHIVKALYFMFYQYIFVEILNEGNRWRRFIKMFSLANMLFMPLLITYMHGTEIIHEGRLSPMMPTGVAIQPNNFAMILTFSFWANVLCIHLERFTVPKIFHAVHCCLCVLFIFLSGSRSSMLGLCVASVFLLLTVWKKYLVPAVLLLVLFLATTQLTADNPFVKRFSVDRAVDYRNGRFESWLSYYKYSTPKHWLIGVGSLATTSTIIYKYANHFFIGIPSNTYIYMFLTYGIGGFGCFCVFLLKIFLKLRAKIYHCRGVRDYVHMAMFLSCCVWMVSSYAQVLGSTQSMIDTYLVAQALREERKPA